MKIRLATPGDAASIAAIYNQGIEERTATFETALRSDEAILEWFDDAHPVVVATDDADEVMAFARASEYSPRDCYLGVFEFAVYTDFSHRRQGAAMAAMRELTTRARDAGAWKLVGKVFVDNEPCRMLMASLGFREVGVHHRHAKLDGRWRDVVLVEKFLAPIGGELSVPPVPKRAPRDQIVLSLKSADASERQAALKAARSFIDVHRKTDLDLLDAVADACLASKLRDASVRASFVDFLRAYSTVSAQAAQEVDAALFMRLARMNVPTELDAFYEVAFVAKQVICGGHDAARMAGIGTYRPFLLGWINDAIALPRLMRGRISPGNLVSVLMTLAIASSASDEEKQELAMVAVGAKEHHRVEPSSILPPPSPRPPPVAPPSKRPRKKRASRAKKRSPA